MTLSARPREERLPVSAMVDGLDLTGCSQQLTAREDPDAAERSWQLALREHPLRTQRWSIVFAFAGRSRQRIPCGGPLGTPRWSLDVAGRSRQLPFVEIFLCSLVVDGSDVPGRSW